MEIMELAAQLGQAIKADARIEALNKAREAYENDTKLQGAVLEYNTQQTALTEEYKKSEPDDMIVKAIEARINTLYHEIIEAPSYIAYNQAQEEVNAFMNEVNAEITYQITGERPCTHDCSTCGGSCGHNH